MYIFMTLEQITNFLLKFGIDISSFNNYELTITFILCNLYKIITIFVLGYITYRIILKMKDFILGF